MAETETNPGSSGTPKRRTSTNTGSTSKKPKAVSYLIRTVCTNCGERTIENLLFSKKPERGDKISGKCRNCGEATKVVRKL